MASTVAPGPVVPDAPPATEAPESQQAIALAPVDPAPPVADVLGPGDVPLPAAVAYVPVANPASAAFPAEPAKPAVTAPTVAAVTPPAPVAAPTSPVVASADQPPATEAEFILTNPSPTVAQPAPKKRGFLSNLFGATPAEAAPMPIKPAAERPLIQLASADGARKPISASAFTDGDGAALPGVRQTALFEIKRKSGLDDDSDVDLHEGDDEQGSYRVASAAGLARLAPNGLLTQTDRVDVACLKPSLVRTLKLVERHYGRKIMVTSGYRDPQRNRRARGAKNSLHMYCAAADVQVAGVTKWELANFVRALPGRGGVGTYCHTESVHIDVGPERDWNWRCRGKRKRK